MTPTKPDLADHFKRHWLIYHPNPVQGASLLDQIVGFGQFRASLIQDLTYALGTLPSIVTAFDGVVLDAGSDRTGAAQLCRTLRRCAMVVPILIMGDWSDEDAVVGALESGADDFIPRSSPSRLLAARMRSHLRAYDACDYATFPLGDLRFHMSGRLLTNLVQCKRVRLTVPEAKLLSCFVQAKGDVVAQDTLTACLWGRPVRNSRALDSDVNQLRQKLLAVGGRILPVRAGNDLYRLARAG